MDTTLPETNSSHLKMVISNRNLQTSRGPPFSGAKMLVSGRLIWKIHWKFPPLWKKRWRKNANLLDGVFRIALRLFLCCRHRGLDEFQRFFFRKSAMKIWCFFWGVMNIYIIYLEPKCPLFWLEKTFFWRQNKGQMGSDLGWTAPKLANSNTACQIASTKRVSSSTRCCTLKQFCPNEISPKTKTHLHQNPYKKTATCSHGITRNKQKISATKY